jgi:hypothetical protein
MRLRISLLSLRLQFEKDSDSAILLLPVVAVMVGFSMNSGFKVLLLLIFFVSLLLTPLLSLFFPDDALAMSDVRPVDDAAVTMSCSKSVNEEGEYCW